MSLSIAGNTAPSPTFAHANRRLYHRPRRAHLAPRRSPRSTINRGHPRTISSHHLTPLSSLIVPHHSQSKASTTPPEFHWSLPLPEKKGASDWSRPRRSHRYQEIRRRQLRRSPASPTLARTPVSPQHPSLAALGFVLAGAVSR